MYVYIELFVSIYRTFIHVGTYMFFRNYNALRSIESLCWIVSNTCNYSETKHQRLGIL